MFFVVFGRNILKKVKMRHLGSLTNWGGWKESQLVNESLFAFEWTDDASRPPQEPTVVQRYHNWHHYVKKDLRVCVCDSICVSAKDQGERDSLLCYIHAWLEVGLVEAGTPYASYAFAGDQRELVNDTASGAHTLVSEVNFRWLVQISECEV